MSSNTLCVKVQEKVCGEESYILHINSLKLDNNIIPLSNAPPKNNIIAKGDSEASTHHWLESKAICITIIWPYIWLLSILLAADTIAPSKKGVWSLLNKFSIAAKIATFSPHLKNSWPIYLGQVYNNKYTIIFDKKQNLLLKNKNIANKYKNNNILLEGKEIEKMYYGIFQYL